MRKINVTEWTVKNPEGVETKENLLQVLSILVTNKKPEDLPRGLEQFKLFNKLIKAFEKAEVSKILELEEDTYKFLKNTIDRDIPSIWGTNKNIVEAIDNFYNAKEE
jgi:hypothetical protein